MATTDSDNKLTAVRRTEFGKGAARRTRRAGLVPAVLYGHGTDPLHIALPGHQAFLALKHTNALLELDVEGETHLGLVKEVQRDPVRGDLVHVDLIIVRAGEKVEVEVPVRVAGEPFPGSIAIVEMQTVRLLVEATAVPEHVEVSVEGLTPGTLIHTGDIPLPTGAALAEDADLLVVGIEVPRTEVPAEDALEEAVAEESEE